MLGEIRLGFFLDGVGWYKDCSELLYTIDSSTDSRYFKEGQILEIDQAFFKVQAVELRYVAMPWKGKGEKPNRDKPIKMVYVTKAKVGMMSDASKKKIVAVNTIPKLKELPEFDIAGIVDDTEYTQDNFKEDFPHLDKPVKKTRKKKEDKKLAKADVDKLKSLKRRKIKVTPEKKEEKPAKNLRRRVRTTDVMDMLGGNADEKPKKGSETSKKAKDKPVAKKTKKTKKKAQKGK